MPPEVVKFKFSFKFNMCNQDCDAQDYVMDIPQERVQEVPVIFIPRAQDYVDVPQESVHEVQLYSHQ